MPHRKRIRYRPVRYAPLSAHINPTIDRGKILSFGVLGQVGGHVRPTANSSLDCSPWMRRYPTAHVTVGVGCCWIRRSPAPASMRGAALCHPDPAPRRGLPTVTTPRASGRRSRPPRCCRPGHRGLRRGPTRASGGPQQRGRERGVPPGADDPCRSDRLRVLHLLVAAVGSDLRQASHERTYSNSC